MKEILDIIPWKDLLDKMPWPFWLLLVCLPFLKQISSLVSSIHTWWENCKYREKQRKYKESLVLKGGVFVRNENQLHDHVYESKQPVYIYIEDYWKGDGVRQLLGLASQRDHFDFKIAVIKGILDPLHGSRTIEFDGIGGLLREVTGFNVRDNSLPGLMLYDPDSGLSLEVDTENSTIESICGGSGSTAWEFLYHKGKFSELSSLSDYMKRGEFPAIRGVYYGHKAMQAFNPKRILL